MPPLVAAAPPLSRPPRGRPPTPGLRESILRAAEDIFTRRDYHEVQMDELASTSGVGKGTLYRYFRSKRDLYLAVTIDGIGRLRAQLEAAVQTSEPPALKIEHIVRCTLGYFWDRRLFFALIHQHEHKPDKDTHEWFHQREQLVRLVRHAFDQAIAAGHVRRVDSRIATEMLFGMMRGVNRYRVRGDRLEALATALVDVFMHGVGTPSGRRTLMKRRAKGPEGSPHS
ncbi:MAG: TetR/AcrR family transcriptional regulator [Deltaproteobacteria bacterium]|nr:MAG: TetR/AcrR family transcriptional regulator [Deltaproteobacteria bacterium]